MTTYSAALSKLKADRAAAEERAKREEERRELERRRQNPSTKLEGFFLRLDDYAPGLFKYVAADREQDVYERCEAIADEDVYLTVNSSSVAVHRPGGLRVDGRKLTSRVKYKMAGGDWYPFKAIVAAAEEAIELHADERKANAEREREHQIQRAKIEARREELRGAIRSIGCTTEPSKSAYYTSKNRELVTTPSGNKLVVELAHGDGPIRASVSRDGYGGFTLDLPELLKLVGFLDTLKLGEG